MATNKFSIRIKIRRFYHLCYHGVIFLHAIVKMIIKIGKAYFICKGHFKRTPIFPAFDISYPAGTNITQLVRIKIFIQALCTPSCMKFYCYTGCISESSRAGSKAETIELRQNSSISRVLPMVRDSGERQRFFPTTSAANGCDRVDLEHAS